ncbi:MAG: DUF4012 domain-containing protein [Patescibacteria group bacterium]|nr:DUF4012 domain-containing protein [Patescibacteria group bacterium]
MAKIVPVKNIEKTLADIKHPGHAVAHKERVKKEINLTYVPQKKPEHFQRTKLAIKISLIAGILLIIGLVALFIVGLRNTKDTVVLRGQNIVQNFSSSVSALGELDPDKASEYLRQNSKEIEELNKIVNESYGNEILNTFGKIIPAIKEAGSLFSRLTSLNINFLSFSEALSDIQRNGFNYFQSNGELFIKRLSAIRGLIEKIISQIEEMKNGTANLQKISPFFENLNKTIGNEYVRRGPELHELKSFLSGLINLVSSIEERHLVLFFQNPAEIRPGGGFIGSYADLILKNGQMDKIEVHDIYDPDGQLPIKVIPPEPLQGMTETWGARDANWFFDFPTSARTVIDFLETSKMYEEKNIKFEGAIAININVLQSVLELLGPIPLAEYKLIIDKDNFLAEIQREVEAGKDKKAGEPKRIIKILTPIILEKLQKLSFVQQKKFIADLQNHINLKDIMFFAKNSELADYFRSKHLDGGVFELPNKFWGSYLAVVNANVAGGKSDAFVDENINVRIDIDIEGGILTDVAVTRTHNGQDEKDSWWRATNKNYIQFLTEPNSSLVTIKGNDIKSISKRNYDVDGFVISPILKEIEQTKTYLKNFGIWTTNAFGKAVFATWFNVPAGQSKILEIRYQTPGSSEISLEVGRKFNFIFDKQSGVNNSLKLTIAAPVGYYWAESNDSMFVYKNQNSSKREIITLTLKK